MLKLYICPNCKLVRYVSLENTTCYRCNIEMLYSETPYTEYIALLPEERVTLVEDFLSTQTNSTKDI